MQPSLASPSLSPWFERWPGTLLLVGLTLLLLPLGLNYPLLEPDEGRHAEIAREMLVTRDWLIPTLFGKPYLNKPALFYWVLAGVLSVFSPEPWVARLVPVLAGLLTLGSLVCFVRRWLGARVSFFTGLVLLTSAGFVAGCRFVLVDMLLTLWVTLSLCWAYHAVESGGLRWGCWLLSACCCGLAVLTKGLVPVGLVGPVLLYLSCTSRQSWRLRLASLAAYACVLLAVVLPYYVACAGAEPTFVRQFFFDQHYQRFVGTQHHRQPFWFYVPVLLLGLFPGSCWGAALVKQLVKQRRAMPAVVRFALVWAGWGVTFLSLSQGKLPTYVLPTFPAWALLLGWLLAQPVTQTSRWSAWQVRARVALFGLALCLLGITHWVILPRWSAQRSPLAEAARWSAWVQEKPTLLVHACQEWGSVAYKYGEGRPLVHSKDFSPAELKLLLSEQSRAVWLTDQTIDEERLREMLPSDWRITQSLDSGKARVHLTERAP